MTLSVAPSREYVCPGEGYAITWSVHRARVAAGYAACRECPLRDESESSLSTDQGADAPRSPTNAFRRLFVTEGVRGVYRNELDHAAAERIATALAAMLWEDADINGGRPANGFPVVVGYDERPWSLSLAVAAGDALRRSGCETIDIGLTTAPAFRFAVAHVDAAAGVLATGAGGGPAMVGFDFAGSGGRPFSAGTSLDRLRELGERPIDRLTRQGGGRREFDAVVPYEAGLRKHWRVFGSLTGIVGTASALVRSRLERLATELPTTLRTIALPRRSRDEQGGDSVGLARIAEAVREAKADFGLWIDEAGVTCRALDEVGRVLPDDTSMRLLIADGLADRPTAGVALDWSLAERFKGGHSPRCDVIPGNGTAEAMFVSLRDHAPACGADAAGRFWLPGSPPTCDALVTMTRLLRVIGTAGEPLSQRIEERG